LDSPGLEEFLRQLARGRTRPEPLRFRIAIVGIGLVAGATLAVLVDKDGELLEQIRSSARRLLGLTPGKFTPVTAGNNFQERKVVSKPPAASNETPRGIEMPSVMAKGPALSPRLVDTVAAVASQPTELRHDLWRPRPERADSTMKATLWRVARETATEWLNAKPFRLAAALAYYTLFSMAPLLVVALGITGLVFGQEAARGEIFGPLQSLLGPKSADAVQSAVAAAAIKSSGIVATVAGIITLLIGASAVFGELQDALNTIWKAKPPDSAGIWNLVKVRLLSMAMVAVIGFLLLVSLVLSTILNAMGAYLDGVLPLPAIAIEAMNFAVSFAVVTVLFASIFKVLPDIKIAWSDVWIGAAFTAALFTVGKSLIGIYIGRMALDSTYGAAGSLLVVLVWVYYSSLILYLGAEFTHVYACKHGSHCGDSVGPTEKARQQTRIAV
jgi:membrane protein